ncbi:MAG TPA: DUF4340 domain-containing protein [Gemmataceae bacterium]|nr:DUF4340 domain-containing protein [Gemmataceae bacterium]
MNFKTTLSLLVVAVAGGTFWLVYHFTRPKPPHSETINVLKSDLKPDTLSRIEVVHGKRRVILERGRDRAWYLPGKWPTRKQEVAELVGLLTRLDSRFAPKPLADPPELTPYGLAKPSVTVTVRAGDKDYRLQFGEKAQEEDGKPGEKNRFSRPTFLRLDDQPEVVQLAPGLVAALDREPDHYQQRRLFRSDRLKPGEEQDTTESLAARALLVQAPQGGYGLTKTGDEWDLAKPVHDHTDPDKLKSVLAAVPDIWAEQFIQGAKKDLAAYGLKDPTESISVTQPGGETITLLIGKPSPREEKRTVMRPSPPGPPSMPELPPHEETIVTRFRYAKLKDNEQIFEIKDDKLKDILVKADTLRDPRLARFSTDDVRRVEVTDTGGTIVLDKVKDQWRLKEPVHADAETSKVNDLLDKLSGLEAKGPDIIDHADPKSYGLAIAAATVRIKVEETKGKGEVQTKKQKTLTFLVGKDEAARSKVYVRLKGWERINGVDDSLVKLVRRPALAYRNRRIFDFASSDLAKVEVENGGTRFALEQVKDTWRLASPVRADVDSTKAFQLADDLGRLEAEDYLSDTPTKEELDKRYGLAKPAVRATVTFTKKDKPAKSLLVGKQRDGKAEYYAKLDSDPAVFVIKKDIYTTLQQDSLAYRPLELWKVQPEQIDEVRLQKAGQEALLKRQGKTWQILEPFHATAAAEAVKPMTTELAELRAERYVANVATEAGTYGLDKPYLRLVVQSEAASADTTPKKETPDARQESKPRTEHVLLIGKPTAKRARSRYAQLGNGEAVFVLGEKFIGAVDHGALDLLDRDLLRLDARSVTRVQTVGKGGPLTLQREGEKDVWRLVSPAVKFQADLAAVDALLGVWSDLRAERFVKYGGKLDLKEFGLDRPAAIVTVSAKKGSAADKKTTTEHALILGRATTENRSERYARLDNGPGVFVLGAGEVAELTRAPLGFVDRTVLKFDAGVVKAIDRRMAADRLELAMGANGWQLTKPATWQADGPTVASLLEELALLRGERVAAYRPKDLKPFGLDTPSATLTLRLRQGTPTEHVLKIGKVVEDKAGKAAGDRYVLAENTVVVAVIPGQLAQRLLGPPLHFRDRDLAHFGDANRATLQRGPRKAVFAKVEGTWKLTSPLEAEAEPTALDDFVNAVRRLRAYELVADKPDSLKPYGLDRPEIHWQFQSNGKERLTLWIGAREQLKENSRHLHGPRRYAKLANRDLVFLLDAGLTDRVEAEYRSRSVWASLDAAQVDTLTYTGARGSFALEKVGSSWQVVGKPEIMVKSEAVTETLDALASLRAERYVVDKDADFKLYGLEPPQLTVQVGTQGAKRVLYVGRTEGTSKRYYARVAEPDRSDVFVISAKEAANVVREVGAFGKGPGKSGKKMTPP